METRGERELDHIPDQDLKAEILERWPSLDVFARHLGISRVTLWRLINGQAIAFPTAVKIARALEISTDDLAEIVGLDPELLERREEAAS